MHADHMRMLPSISLPCLALSLILFLFPLQEQVRRGASWAQVQGGGVARLGAQSKHGPHQGVPHPPTHQAGSSLRICMRVQALAADVRQKKSQR
jgi:hypothetical protein